MYSMFVKNYSIILNYVQVYYYTIKCANILIGEEVLHIVRVSMHTIYKICVMNAGPLGMSHSRRKNKIKGKYMSLTFHSNTF